MTSTMPPEIAKALVAAQRATGAVAKDATNTFQRYRYASAEAIVLEAREALAASGLACVTVGWHLADGAGVARIAGKQKRDEGQAEEASEAPLLVVQYALVHDSGASWLAADACTSVIVEAGRPQDKAIATALTYNLGYFLRGLLLIPRVEEGTDADQRDDRGYQPRRPQPPALATEAQQEDLLRLADSVGMGRDKLLANCQAKGLVHGGRFLAAEVDAIADRIVAWKREVDRRKASAPEGGEA